MEYKLLRSDDPNTFEQGVQDHLLEGWELWGNTEILRGSDRNDFLTQAVIRKRNPTNIQQTIVWQILNMVSEENIKKDLLQLFFDIYPNHRQWNIENLRQVMARKSTLMSNEAAEALRKAWIEFNTQ